MVSDIADLPRLARPRHGVAPVPIVITPVSCSVCVCACVHACVRPRVQAYVKKTNLHGIKQFQLNG